MIKNLQLPLKVINGEICDANGKTIMLMENKRDVTPLLPSERDELIHLAVNLINNNKTLNEAQLGDKVLYNKQKGYIIGQTSNGDFIVQIQGSSEFVKPSDVKVINGRASTIEPPFKFDKVTQKLLFEQFVRCGIFMGNTPVKVSNCYVKYSQWQEAKMNENINVIAEGEMNIMPRENVRVFEDPNEFANTQDYVEGVIVNEETGDAIESVMINAIDYSTAFGDANSVRVIRGLKTDNPSLENLPKAILKTLSV